MDLTTTTVTNLPSFVHDELDQDIDFLSSLPFQLKAGKILASVINGSAFPYSETDWPIVGTTPLACDAILASNRELRDLLELAHRSGKYAEIRSRCEQSL
jgi:hypothetical protein